MGARIGSKCRGIQKSRVEKSGVKLQSLTEAKPRETCLGSKNREFEKSEFLCKIVLIRHSLFFLFLDWQKQLLLLFENHPFFNLVPREEGPWERG